MPIDNSNLVLSKFAENAIRLHFKMEWYYSNKSASILKNSSVAFTKDVAVS
jgi:hypothetical protein